MKIITIKTVDGSQIDYICKNGIDKRVFKDETVKWLVFDGEHIFHWIYVPNIISITEKETDDA